MGGFRQASGRGKADGDRQLHEGHRRPEEGRRRLQSLIAFGAILSAVGISVALFAVGCERQQPPPKQEPVVAERMPEPPAVAPRKLDGPRSIPECLRYQQLHYTLQHCTKLPQQARDALRQGYEAMTQGWANWDQMPAEAHAAIARACKQAGDALVQVGGATCGLDDDTPVEAPANIGGEQLPQACLEYRALIYRLQSCENMPQQARDALKQGFEAMEQGWANIGAMPAEAREALADGCRKGTDALRHAASATCEW